MKRIVNLWPIKWIEQRKFKIPLVFLYLYCLIVSVIQQSDFLGTIFHSTQAVIFWAWGGLSQKQVNITWLFNLIKPNEPFLEVPTHYYLGRSTHYFIHHKSPQNVSLFPKRIFTRSLPGFALLEVIHDIRMMFLVFWLIHSVWEKNLGEMQFFFVFFMRE